MRHANNLLIAGMALSILFSIADVLLEKYTYLGESLEEWTYDALQRMLSWRAGSSPQVDSSKVPLIIDISNAPIFVKDPDAKTRQVMTKREPLQEMVDEALKHKPAAIGIDLNFSPDAKGLATLQDWAFLNHLVDISKENGVCIYVGVHESVSFGPDKLLVNSRLKNLATCIAVPNEKNRSTWAMPEQLSYTYHQDPDGPPESAQCPTMGFALATAALRRAHAEVQTASPANPSAQSSGPSEDPCDVSSNSHLKQADVADVPFPRSLFMQSYEKRSPKDDQGRDIKSVEGKEFRVDYSPLEDLSSRAQRAEDAEGVRRINEQSSFRNKIVLFGWCENTPDTFIVPGRPDRPYAGVFLHACAAYSLLQERPLRYLGLTGQFALDFFFSLAIFGTVHRYRWWRIKKPDLELRAQRVQQVLILFALVFMTFGLIFLTLYARVMWDDFIFVFAALLLHSPFEHSIEGLGKLGEAALSRG